MSVGFPAFRSVQAFGSDLDIQSTADIGSLRVFNQATFTNKYQGYIHQALVNGGILANDGEVFQAALVEGNLINNNKVKEVGAIQQSSFLNFGEVETLLAEDTMVVNKNLIALAQINGGSTYKNDSTTGMLLADDVTKIINNGDLIATTLLGETELLNNGTIGDVFLKDKSKAANDNGYINTVAMRDETQLLNNSAISNLDAKGNIDIGNDGFINNLKLEANDRMLINFLNAANGLVQNFEADVLSPNNLGFIVVENQGRLKNVDLYDYAGIGERYLREEEPPPPPPPPPDDGGNPDLIDLHNYGIIDNLYTDTYTFSEEFKRGTSFFERFSRALIRIFQHDGTIINSDYNGNTELH